MDFIQYLRDRISELRSERDAAHSAVTDVLAAPTAESRDLNETEAAAFAEARDHLAMAFVMRPDQSEYGSALSQVKATLRARALAGLPLAGPIQT